MGAIKDPVGRREWALSRLDRGCIVCGTLAPPDFRGFSVHHILGGNCGRSDEPANYALVDGVCHDLAEGRQIRQYGKVLPTISLGLMITIKMIRDHEDFSLSRLAELNRERLPHLEPIPDWIERHYKVNHPIPFRPWRPAHAEVVAKANAWIDGHEILR